MGDRWLGLVCDGSGATVLAARGRDTGATLLASGYLEFPDGFATEARLAALDEFVATNGLGGLPAFVAFAGAGTVVQPLHLPPLSPRNRQQAIRTRLQTYAGDDDLVIAVRPTAAATPQGQRVLAGAAPTVLVRALQRACTRAGLRVRTMNAWATAAGAPDETGVQLQLLLGERTSTIQLFHDAQLISARDVLLGRHDFVQAYQRPILADAGPITLRPAEAEELLGAIGVPLGREDEVRPGIRATQLWPTLDPVLQKLRRELEQSLTHTDVRGAPARLSLRAAPPLAGLAEFLTSDMQLAGTGATGATATAAYLAALRNPHTALDLRPPEIRWTERLTRPALVAGLAALLVIIANYAGPRAALAEVARLRPAAEKLAGQIRDSEEQRAAAEQACAGLTTELQRRADLVRALPPSPPVLAALKMAFASLPGHVRLVDVQFQGAGRTASLELRASYAGDVAASVVAAQWTRALAQSGAFAGAKVRNVTGSGRTEPSLVEIEAVLK